MTDADCTPLSNPWRKNSLSDLRWYARRLLALHRVTMRPADNPLAVVEQHVKHHPQPQPELVDLWGWWQRMNTCPEHQVQETARRCWRFLHEFDETLAGWDRHLNNFNNG